MTTYEEKAAEALAEAEALELKAVRYDRVADVGALLVKPIHTHLVHYDEFWLVDPLDGTKVYAGRSTDAKPDPDLDVLAANVRQYASESLHRARIYRAQAAAYASKVA